jgi:hypothetical protein
MDRKTTTLLGTAAALAAAPGLAAAPQAMQPAVPVAASYAELLEPIPNAVERLQLADTESAAQPPRLILAQYAPAPGPVAHHHHHHHHHNRRWYLANGYYWHGGAWVLRPVHHHHHHHHDDHN